MVKIIEPKLPTQLDTDLIFPNEEESLIEHAAFRQMAFPGEYLRYTIKKCHFQHCDFTQSRFQQLELQDVIFTQCDLSNLEWIGTSIHRVQFVDCKLFGTNLAESFLQDCLFKNCLADYASFNFSKLKNVRLLQCSNQFCEFSEIDWKHWELIETKLTDSRWLHTNLNQLDLSTCSFEKIGFSSDKISGLILNQEQALIIAMSLGIIIHDPY